MADIKLNADTGEIAVALPSGGYRIFKRGEYKFNADTGQFATPREGGGWDIHDYKAAPAQPSPEQRQAGYLASYPDLTGIPLKSEEVLTRDPDYIREVPNSLLHQAHGALGNYVDAGMLGWADETLAAIEAAPKLLPGGETFSGAYGRELSRLEQQRRDYNAVNSGQAKAATGAGVVLNPLNVMGGELISAAPSVGGRFLRAATVGGLTGGVAGAGMTEGTAGDKAVGGAVGAGVGLLTAPAGQAGAELLGLGGKVATETGRAIINTVRNNAVAKANPSEQADRLLARAFLDDDLMRDLPMRAESPMPGQGLVNLGGENVTGLARQSTVAQGPGRTIARNFFDEQRAGQSDRAADAAKGLTDKGYYGTIETLDKTREATAAPLYNLAREKGAAGVWNDQLANLIKRPSLAQAWQKAQAIAADRGIELPQVFITDAAGKITGIRQVPTIEVWDFVKRGLDDVIGSHRNATTGKIETDLGRGVVGLKQDLLAELDSIVPEYAQARAAWSGPTHSIEMLDLGRDLWRAKGDPGDAIRKFQALSDVDKTYVRIGVARDIIRDAGNVSDTGSIYQKLFNNPNKRALLQSVFPSKASFESFSKAMEAERRMFNTANTVMGGSPTARIEADKAALSDAENTLGLIDALKSGSIPLLIGKTLQRAKNLQQGVSPQVAAELARRLFTASPEELAAIASRITGVRTPAPLTALAPGLLEFGRRTPVAPLIGQGSGLLGEAIATPSE